MGVVIRSVMHENLQKIYVAIIKHQCNFVMTKIFKENGEFFRELHVGASFHSGYVAMPVNGRTMNLPRDSHSIVLTHWYKPSRIERFMVWWKGEYIRFHAYSFVEINWER